MKHTIKNNAEENSEFTGLARENFMETMIQKEQEENRIREQGGLEPAASPEEEILLEAEQDEVPAPRTHRHFLFENREKREINGKYYTGNDGTLTAVFTKNAVHYLDPEENQLKEIDNRLLDTGDVLETKANAFQTKFKKISAKGEVFELVSGNCKVSLISRDATNNGGQQIVRGAGDIRDGEASDFVLKNVRNHVDIQYIAHAEGIKENIIIKEKSNAYEFRFDLLLENVTVDIAEDGKSLDLKNTHTGETQFYLPAPFLIDEAGAYSDLVRYEIEVQETDKLRLTVLADADWINAEERVFPVVIDPQIQYNNTKGECFTYQNYYRNISSGSGSGSGSGIAYSPWYPVWYSDMRACHTGSQEYKCELTVKKSMLNADWPYLAKKISKVMLNLRAVSGYAGGCLVNGVYKNFPADVFTAVDITDDYLAASGDLAITFASSIGSSVRLEAGGANAPYLEIEYLRNSELSPARESLSLAGGIRGELDLDTGELVTTFSDVTAGGGPLSFPIYHIHKLTDGDFSCGKDWRLNLHQKLDNSSSSEANWIYTDESGRKHDFNEVFYYENQKGEKIEVPKSSVQVAPDGRMTVNCCGIYDVSREFLSDTGLQLQTRLRNVSGAANLEQRLDEEKQLEEQTEAYRNNLKNMAVISTADGTVVSELKNYFQNDTLPETSFNSFVASASASGRMVLSKNEALQYRSLVLQKKQLSDQITALSLQKNALDNQKASMETQLTALDLQKASMNTQRTALNHQNASMNTQKALLTVQASSINAQRTAFTRQNESLTTQKASLDLQSDVLFAQKDSIELNRLYFDPSDAYDPSVKASFVSNLYAQHLAVSNQLAGTNGSIPKQKTAVDNLIASNTEQRNVLADQLLYVGVQKNDLDNQINSVEAQRTDLQNQIDLIAAQKSNLNSQIANTNAQKTGMEVRDMANIQAQITAAANQIGYITDNAAASLQELKRLFKESVNLEYRLKKMKSSIPVAYITGKDGIRLCFNTHGDLCAVTDAYENYLVVEWDDIHTSEGTKNVIAAVSGEDKKTVFQYNRRGLLTSVTDPRGRRVSYTYPENNNALEKVIFPGGETVSFAYSGFHIVLAASSDETSSTLTYDQYQLVNAVTHSTASAITETGVVPLPAEEAPIELSFLRAAYGENYASVTTKDMTAEYYLDLFGGITGKTVNYADGKKKEKLSFSYVRPDKKFAFSVSENSGKDAVWQSPGPFTVQGAGLSLAELSSDLFHTGQFAGEVEFMLSAIAQPGGTLPDTTDRYIQTAFTGDDIGPEQISSGTKPLYRLRADVTYRKNQQIIGQRSFVMPVDYRAAGKQLVALPITLDRDKMEDFQIKIIPEYTGGSGAAVFSDFRLAPASWEHVRLDGWHNPVYKESSTVLLNQGATANTYAKSVTAEWDITYDEEHRLLKERVTDTIWIGDEEEAHYSVTSYAYNNGVPLRIENWIEGEEGTAGSSVKEFVYDSKGRVTREIAYHSLESSTKFITEREYGEDGLVKADFDETGEGKVLYEYNNEVDAANVATDYDASGRLLSISMSSDEGNANTISAQYSCGLITKLTSGNKTVGYEYDAKRLLNKVVLDGLEHSVFTYEENILHNGKLCDKSVSVLINDSAETTNEAWTDKRGNIVEMKADNITQVTNEYQPDDTLSCTVDGITGSEATYQYDPANKRVTRIEKTAGTKVAAITEAYEYNAYGQVSSRRLTGAVNHVYDYAYQDNAERELDYITLPNGLRSKAESDANKRTKGYLLTDTNGDNLFGTHLTYRKHGNRGTNMVSSLCYGTVQNGRYVIREGLKYRYDAVGNIAEVRENGIASVRYAYDKLSRLIREDNRNVGKTFLFSYDSNGNILSKIETAYTVKPTEEITEFENRFCYDYDGMQGDRLTGINGESITYDRIGNPLTYFGKALTWQKGRQLAQFDTITFSYDGYGRRIEKNNVVYTYSADGVLRKQSDGTDTLEFLYDEFGLIGLNHNGTDYLYRKNLLGDVTHILDRNGNVLVRYDYDAWGRHAVTDHSNTNLGQINPFRYRGCYYDVETGFYFLQTRYYDPTVGRFINADEILYLNPEIVDGLNLYAYCSNNPVMRTDRTGQSWWDDLWGGLKSFGYGLYQGVSSWWNGITGGFASLFNGIVGSVKSSVGILTGTVSSLWGGFTGAASSFRDGITSGSLSDLCYGYASAISALANGIGEAFRAIGNGTVNSYSALFKGLGGYFSDSWNGIKDAAVYFGFGIAGLSKGIWNGVLKPAWNFIKSAAAAIGKFLVKAVKVIGGSVMTILGGLFTLRSLPLASFLPGGGYLTQMGFSAMMYGVFTVGSVFDSQIQSDMNEIGWNPFNSKEAATLQSEKVSFYKGMPVIRIDGRSGSFLGIFLRRGSDVETLRHERGHGTHQGMIGPLRFGLTVGISSPPSLGPWYDVKTDEGDYYAAPWETIADLFGGVSSRNHSAEEKIRAGLYTAVSLLCPPATYLFLLWK